MQSPEIKKLFAKLEEIGGRLSELDSNGKLDDIGLQIKTAVANSEVVLSCVQRHSSDIAYIKASLEKLELRCPLLKPTGEFESVGTDPGDGC